MQIDNAFRNEQTKPTATTLLEFVRVELDALLKQSRHVYRGDARTIVLHIDDYMTRQRWMVMIAVNALRLVRWR